MSLWLGAFAVLMAGVFNSVAFVTEIFLLLSGVDGPNTGILLVASSLSALFLVALPLWVGITALRGSADAAGWAILYFVAQFLVAFLNMDPLRYGISVVALAAAVLLWVPATRKYSRQQAHLGTALP